MKDLIVERGRSIAAAHAASQQKEKCEYCNNEHTLGNIRKHRSICMHSPANRKDCRGCGIQIFVKANNFCSKSCAATTNNSSRDLTSRRAPYLCIFCGETFARSPSQRGKYCSGSCNQKHKWEITKKKITDGNVEGRGKTTLRKFLVETFGDNCSECGIRSFWNGKSLTLEMDHRDGNNKNNHPSNLRLLCPNCHTQTPTWGGKMRQSRPFC